MTVSTPESAVWERFRQVIEHRHDYARQWQARSGGKVMGYMCTYVAEEIIYAAGVLPVRIMGSREPQDLTDTYIYSLYCPYCRDCLAEGLKGRYDYLDAITETHTCSHIRQTFDAWQKYIPIGFAPYVYMPANVQNPRAGDMFLAELKQFRQAIQEWTGQPITDADLDRAIEVYNTNRRLLRQIYELRQAHPAPISGVEALEMVLASFYMDKAEHNYLLLQALEEISRRPVGPDPRVRLMTIGSENEDPELIRLIESMGTQVVIDEQCTGSRYFWNEVAPQPDRLQAIARRYLERPLCPLKDLQKARQRPGHILKLAQDYQVQGAIILRLKFCDPHEYDLPIIQRQLEAQGIPTLVLERDIVTPLGQFKTRIGAFLELLQEELV